MAGREDTERAARAVIDAITREFPDVTVHLDFDRPRDDHEDAYLWITAGTKDREEINDIWGYAVRLVQEAYNEDDVYLVARMKGASVIDRERPRDQDF